MAVLTGLSGNVDVSVGGVSRVFTDYGVPQTLTYAVTALRSAVLVDPTTPDTIDEIIVAPARGNAVIRADNNITLDLSDETAVTDMTITYTRTTGGTQEQVEATITVDAAKKGGGWATGRHYMLETDANDAVIIEPGEDARIVHIDASSTLTAAQIASDEGVSEAAIDGEWLRLNDLSAQPGVYYGSTPALALPLDLGLQLSRRLYLQNFTSPWTLFKRGDTFPEYFDGTLFGRCGGFGESRLHPALVGAYGTGNRPHFTNEGPRTNGYTSHLVIQDLSWGMGLLADNGSALILDNLYADYSGQIADGGAGGPYTYSVIAGATVIEGMTVRRCVSLDAAAQAPIGGAATWEGSADRVSGMYIQNVRGILFEKNFIDHAGWADGYQAGADGTLPKPPEIYSHGAYMHQGQQGMIVKDSILTRNSHSAMQFRPGGIMDNVFAAGNNTGVNPANGTLDVVNSVDTGNWSLLHRYVQTSAGFKGMWFGQSNSVVVAGGIHFSSQLTATIDSIVINAGVPAQTFAANTDIGPGANTNPPPASHYWATQLDNIPFDDTLVVLGRNELIVSNWNRAVDGDTNADGVAEATRDALTIGDYTDTLLATTGSDLDTLCTHLRTLDAPWELVTDINDYFLGPFGKVATTRAVAQTVTFQPDAGGDTPGILASFARDWDTGDLPGTVAGDDIDLAGHRVFWNMTPANSIADLSFGTGGALTIYGGILAPTGAVTVDAAGNSVQLGDYTTGGGKFHIDGYSGSGVLSVEVNESRFMNTGTVAGNIDIIARYASEVILGYDTASFTLNSGRTMDIYGFAKVGFDGASGGTASLILAAGSTLRFMPTIRMDCDGQTQITVSMDEDEGGAATSVKSNYQPKNGAIVTGDTSGAAGSTAKIQRNAATGIYIMMDGLTGVFADNETISCNDTELAYFDRGAQSAFATVKGDPEYTLGQIREIRTGINGFTAPNVASSVTLGGTLHIDVTGMTNGDYDLIVADTVTGVFASVTAAGNSAKDLTVSITGTTVAVEVAAGTGVVTGGT